MRWRGLHFGIAAAAVVADLATKAWARRALSGRGVLWLWRPWFSLRLLYNTGATLGVGAAHERVITVASGVLVLVLAAMVWRVRRGGVGLALMLAGGVGNLASRLLQGRVTDFAHVWFWPGIFNLADVFLRGGALLFALMLLLPPRVVPPKGA